jgi:ABC-type antimicrobial peptide transport system ATPase subunit
VRKALTNEAQSTHPNHFWPKQLQVDVFTNSFDMNLKNKFVNLTKNLQNKFGFKSFLKRIQ